jgi:hypothetical protein
MGLSSGAENYTENARLPLVPFTGMTHFLLGASLPRFRRDRVAPFRGSLCSVPTYKTTLGFVGRDPSLALGPSRQLAQGGCCAV